MFCIGTVSLALCCDVINSGGAKPQLFVLSEPLFAATIKTSSSQKWPHRAYVCMTGRVHYKTVTYKPGGQNRKYHSP